MFLDTNNLKWCTPTFTDILLSGQNFGTRCGFHRQNFWTAIDSSKKQIRLSIAQDLVQVSLTKIFLELSMAVNLLLSNPTQPNLTAIDSSKKPLCQWNWRWKTRFWSTWISTNFGWFCVDQKNVHESQVTCSLIFCSFWNFLQKLVNQFVPNV